MINRIGQSWAIPEATKPKQREAIQCGSCGALGQLNANCDYCGIAFRTPDPEPEQQIVPSTGHVPFACDMFSGDGYTTDFVLSVGVATSSCILVTVCGVHQNPEKSYTLDRFTLTFNEPPSPGTDNITVRHLT